MGADRSIENPVDTPAPIQIGGPIGQIAGLLGNRLSNRTKQALAGIVVAQTVKNLADVAYKKAKAKLLYTVTVDGSDPLYEDVHAWLLDHLPQERQRALQVESRNYWYSGDREGRLALFYDGAREHVIRIDGHKVSVIIERKESPVVSVETTQRREGMMTREKIIFSTMTSTGRDVVLETFERLLKTRKVAERKPRLHIAASYGDWQRREELLDRPLDSVILDGTIAEDLLEDLQDFLNAEGKYRDLGVPWHRGYLFHGPPGTGKTSIARAIASTLGLDVYYVPLRDLPGDGPLTNLVSGISPRGVLLLEDIDAVAPKRDQESVMGGLMGGQVTLSGLLNSLDGVSTPHGLITIMTSNFKDVLDPALIRPGRVDKMVEIGYLTKGQFIRMIKRYLPSQASRLEGLEFDVLPNISPSLVVEQFKSNLNDPFAAFDAAMEVATCNQ